MSEGVRVDEAPAVPKPHRWWRRASVRAVGALVAAVLVLVAVTLIFAALERRPSDPRSDSTGGTSALAELIGDQGVDVRTTSSVTSASRGPSEPWTLVVGLPDDLAQADWLDLLAAGPSDVVLLSPGAQTTAALELPVQVSGIDPGPAEPGCEDPAAGRAGSTAPGSRALGYRGEQAELTCYADGGDIAGYLRLQHQGTRVHLLGTGWANGELLTEGNASFAMQVLGRHPEAVWLTAPEPDPAGSGPDQTGAQTQQPSVLPAWSTLVGLQLVVGFALLLVWRGRRLGPVITEGLPVVVPAGEAVEGHGRLYHRIGAREHAAEVLRAATRRRLSRRLGPEDPLALVGVVNAQTGLDPGWLRHVLTGPPPSDDAALAELAAQLHEIEDRVRAA